MKRAGMRRVAAAVAGLALVGTLVAGGAQPAHAVTILKVDRPEPTLVRVYAWGLWAGAAITITDWSKPVNQRLIAHCDRNAGTYGPCLIALDAAGIHVPETMPRGNYNVTLVDSFGNGATTYTYIPGPPPPPVNTKPPVISDPNPHVGEVLSSTTGSWTNQPTGLEYRWRRCKAGTCVRVGLGPTYTVAPTDLGYRLQVRVIASNAQGSSPAAQSKNTSPVLP